jgi:murein DD-endopeptidase MepM/ murein hydrolase activator NlpD
MRRAVLVTWVCLVAGSSGGAAAGDGAGAGAAPKGYAVTGPVAYLKDGVALGGRTFAWKELGALEDVQPSPAALAAEYERRAKARTDDAAGHLALGRWARDQGLGDRAQEEFDAAVAREPENADARRAAGWVRAGKEWRRTADVAAERRAALPVDPKVARAPKLELAKWCGENGDAADEWALLLELAAADPYDAAMIARVKAVVARRRQTATLVPPLAGRWRAEIDRSRHHQKKVFAIEAIDFRSVDGEGRMFRGKGEKLEDWFGFDSVVVAAGDGVVTDVDDGFPDLPPHVGGKFEEANGVIIEHAPGEFSDYGHTRRGSALVKVGDRVKAGQPIARVGNSGASGQPHLHFTLETVAWGTDGEGEYVGIPWRLAGFRVVDASGTPCDFEAKVARVIEGWTMLFPEKR